MSNGDRPLIVVPSDDPAQCQGSPRMAELEAVADLKIFPTRADSFDLQIERARGATVIINSRSYLEWREDAFDLLPDLRFISVCGIGTDSIDLDAARDHGITVSNIPGKTAPVVAEHAFGLMFAAAKRAAWYTEMTRKGEWVKEDGVFLGGKTVGIVGTGNIGAEMARLCNAFGMNVIAYTFNPSDERAEATRRAVRRPRRVACLVGRDHDPYEADTRFDKNDRGARNRIDEIHRDTRQRRTWADCRRRGPRRSLKCRPFDGSSSRRV